MYAAEWNRFGKSAGYKRNVVMAENAEALLAIWDGTSKGTGHMINIAKERGLKVVVYKREPTWKRSARHHMSLIPRAPHSA